MGLKNIYDFYITPEEIERAEKNGISYKVLQNRIRYKNWDKERAINTPLTVRRKFSKELKETIARNGISMNTFRSRILLGWEIERAASEPIEDKRKTSSRAYEARRKYPKEYIETARSNGISDHTFYDRIKYGWNLEKASTKPTMCREEIAKQSYFRKMNKLLYIKQEKKSCANSSTR